MKKFILIVTLTFCSMYKMFGGGFIIVAPPGHNRTAPLSYSYVLDTKSLKINTAINGQFAETKIEQVFYNSSRMRLEGYFLFPIPKGAIIKDFSMEINGKQMPAELLDAEKARRIYEDIVRKLKDPALLEYSQQGLFKVRIFPIEPLKEKHIKISYSETLKKDNNTLEYVFPLNTKRYNAKPLKNISLKAEVKSDNKIKTLYSPTHQVEINRKGEKAAVIGFESNELKPERDFKLFIGNDNKQLGVSLVTHNKSGEDGFFFMNINPGVATNKTQTINKDITFILDVSGSMAGEKLIQAKKALNFCIDNLNEKDRFEIVRFSTEASALFGKRSEVSKTNLEKAKGFIKELRAIGGTNIEESFEMALKEKPTPSRPHFVIFITDGKPTIGETQEDPLLKKVMSYNTESTRVFTFGIGETINTHLLDKITEQTNAYRSYITPDQDIEIEVSNFYTKVSSPILTDIKVSFSNNTGVSNVFPKKIPDLFKGGSLSLFGRYKNDGKSKVNIEGKVNGKAQKFSYDISFGKEGEDHDFIPPLWAARNVGYLLDQIRLHGDDKELVDEITRLAKKYGIITPYTSYLILEDEQLNITRRDLPRRNMIFNDRSMDDDGFYGGFVEEFSEMNKKSGKGSVRSSKEVQSLNNASNIAATKQGANRMVYRDKLGTSQNFANQVRNIQGRGVYQKGKEWIDLYVQSKSNENLKAHRIQFLSDEYFKLIEKEPKTSDFLSLGKNVRFIYKNKLYEVFE